MKRKYKKRIFAELIILCILLFTWFLIGDKTWIISLWNNTTLEKYLKYFYEERNWTFPGFFAVITFIVYIIFELRKHKVESGKITLPVPSPLPIFEVENIKELGEVSNAIPFMENPAAGKSKEKKTWDGVKKEVDFSKMQPVDLSSQYRVLFITGKPGAGKSTYMLWSLDKSLRSMSRSFNKVVFLNPETYSLWAEELFNYDPKKTILVIDALWRGSDTPGVFKSRCLHLFRLALEEQNIGERTIGPFKVLATIREDEYDHLFSQKEFDGISYSAWRYQIDPKDLDFGKILKKYLDSYKVTSEIPIDKEKDVIKQLVLKSEGLPFYIRHIFMDLKETGRSFSEKTLEEFPIGIVNLIWQTIKRRYYIEEDAVIPFLLLVLCKTDKYFSSHFLNIVIEKNAKEEIKKDVSDKIWSLRRAYFQSFIIKDTEIFALDSHWKISLERGLKQSINVAQELQDVINSYKKILDEQFNRSLEIIAAELKTHLQAGFKDRADIFLCADLAKLSEESLNDATEIYTKLSYLSKLPQEYINYIRDELYELWIGNAWKYRVDPHHKSEDVIRCYENAFDKLCVRSHLKQLSAYAYYLQVRVLPKCKYGTSEFQQYKEKIENLHNEVIKGQLEQGINDPISYQTLALFYEDVGEDEKAEKAFEESLKISPSHIPARQAYAIFLKGRGKREWVRNGTKALEYYKKAEDRFKESIEILESKKKELTPNEIEKYEKRLLNAYAIFLIDKTEWEREFEKRIKINKEVDELFDKSLSKYPNHGQSVNAYARFLMGYGKILPQYKDGKNLQKAEKLLKDFIEAERNKKELSYYMALHILAIYYYKLKPSFYKQRPNFEEAIKLLKDSSRSFRPHHNSIAYNELGQLYVRWANILKKGEPTAYIEKMNMAKEAYEKAMEIVPENQQSAIHLSKVYFNYAFYSQYMGQAEQSETYRQKALEVTKKFAYIPFGYYYSLTSLGDEILKDHDLDMGIRVFTEANLLGECLQIKPWYAIYKLGEIYKEKQDINQALEYYLRSAQIENTSEGWGTRRDSIKHLMKDYNIKKATQPVLYGKCIKARFDCSEQAYQLDQNSWKNCGDYGEDLLEMGEYGQAIPILEKGVSLIQQSDKLNEVDKRKGLSIFHMNFGFCYKNSGNVLKAEENFCKSAEIENSAIGYLKLSDWMYTLGKHKKVLTAFQIFVEKFRSCTAEQKESIFRDLRDVLGNLAISYENLSQEEESALAWKRYADVSFYSEPQEEGAYVCGIAGNKLLKMHKFPEARECFLKSIRLDPNSAKNLSQLGYINKSLQRWEECRICSERAFSMTGDSRDERQYKYCREEYKKNPKAYDTDKIDDLIDLAVIEELKGEREKALKYYSDALTILHGHGSQDKMDISRCMFIADAFWGLGDANKALELYKEVKNPPAEQVALGLPL